MERIVAQGDSQTGSSGNERAVSLLSQMREALAGGFRRRKHYGSTLASKKKPYVRAAFFQKRREWALTNKAGRCPGRRARKRDCA